MIAATAGRQTAAIPVPAPPLSRGAAPSAGPSAGSRTRAASPTRASDTSTTTATPTASDTTTTVPSEPQAMFICSSSGSGRDRLGGRLGDVVDVVGGDRVAPRGGVDPTGDGDEDEHHDDRADGAGARHPGRDRAHGRSRRQGQQPGDRHLAGDPPLDRGEPAP